MFKGKVEDDERSEGQECVTGGFGGKACEPDTNVCVCVSVSISLSAEQRTIPESRSQQPAWLINCRD